MSEYLQKLRGWWHLRTVREKRILSYGALAVSIIFFYFGLWSPLSESATALRTKLVNDEKTLAWMKNVDQQLTRIQQTQRLKKQLTPVIMLGVLQKKIKVADLDQSLTLLKQSANETISIHFQKIEYDQMMAFLIQLLKEQRVAISQFSATATNKPGIVNAEIGIKIV